VVESLVYIDLAGSVTFDCLLMMVGAMAWVFGHTRQSI